MPDSVLRPLGLNGCWRDSCRLKPTRGRLHFILRYIGLLHCLNVGGEGFRPVGVATVEDPHRLYWQQQYPADPELQQLLETDELPVMSVSNVRELLRATMPLPALTPEKAADLVVEHLLNRTRSRKSRLKKQRAQMRDPSSESG